MPRASGSSPPSTARCRCRRILVTGGAGFIGSHYVRTLLSGGYPGTADVTGVQVLLDACLAAGVPRVVHVSTDEVYGSIAVGSWAEGAPLDPNSPYSAAKAGGDLIALAYARTHGLNVSITRCCNNYGPHQYPEKVILTAAVSRAVQPCVAARARSIGRTMRTDGAQAAAATLIAGIADPAGTRMETR